MIEIIFNEAEQKRLDEIRRQENEFSQAVSQGKKEISEYITDSKKLTREIRAIKEQATRRALQAYAEQPQVILDEIRKDIQMRIRNRDKDTPPEKLKLLNFSESLNLKTRYRIFLEWLFEVSPKLFDEAMNMIENAFLVEEQKNVAPDIPKVSTKKPKMYVSPNTKVSNKLFARDNSMLYSGEIKLAVEGTKSKKQFTTLLSVNYDELSRYKVAFQQLAPFDRTVHDAIVSHYINGENEFISTDMIYRVLAGDDGSSSNTHASPELAAAILDSVKRMASTLVRIDASEQARVYKKGFEALYIGNLLYMEMVEVSMNGQKTGCIHILRKPVLYQYANDFSQVTQTDLKILNVPELINSPENIVLKNYLLQQIRIMKYNAAYSRTIRYDTLYELLNIQAASDASLYNKKRKIRECVKKCLDFWKSEGFIQDYTEEPEQHSIAKIILQVKAEKSSTRALPSKNT